jgi:hypothetical protein
MSIDPVVSPEGEKLLAELFPARKRIKYRFSRAKYPTHIVEKVLSIGKVEARKALVNLIGQKRAAACRVRTTMGEIIFTEDR